MNTRRCRFWPLFLMICLAATLVACERFSPTPAPAATTHAPTAMPADTPTEEPPTPTATSEPEEPTAVAATATPTSTPTVEAGGAGGATPSDSRCAGLAGELEIQVLVGPAEAVGMEPVAVGRVPFAATAEPPYVVQGQGPISYDDVLGAAWGTYAVTMDLDFVVEGECSGQEGGEQLDLLLEMTGEQLVVVDAESFQGEYPWSGTQTLDLTFPLEDGATAEGEGWVVVLHLGS